ncbi:MAG TPA: MBL fold metallo-hydrolase [Xanthobacteraceae bacterium]|nr:MBL fold metallo-hydrolase [Xanthobacteraceae bacterium]
MAHRSFSAVLACLIFALAAFIVAARAQPASPSPVKPQMRENCPGLVAGEPPRAVPAALRLAAVNAGEVGIRYIGHATFMIESPQGVTIATDYNDYVRPHATPDIATMNHAHSTHYTDHPDPAIRYVLRGWGTSPDQPARHDLQYRDVRVRNVPTNIRTWNGGTERHGNSIFILEISGLCIAHLGHLHHTLTQQQLDEIGRVDVVMAPVDGSVTLDLDGMVEVLQALQAPLVIPMHYFGMVSLRRFLDALGGKSYDVETSERSSILVSKATLPAKPKVLALPGRAF